MFICLREWIIRCNTLSQKSRFSASIYYRHLTVYFGWRGSNHVFHLITINAYNCGLNDQTTDNVQMQDASNFWDMGYAEQNFVFEKIFSDSLTIKLVFFVKWKSLLRSAQSALGYVRSYHFSKWMENFFHNSCVSITGNINLYPKTTENNFFCYRAFIFSF